MTASETIQELARQVRRGTLEILLAARPNWLTYAPPGTTNHMLWHAGHALWLGDVLCIEALTGRGELPPGWADTFGMNCRPPKTTKRWPDRHELAGLLQQQLARMLAVLAAATDDQLIQTADPSRGSASVAGRIIHGFHDEAKHAGEMYLLFKLCQVGSYK